MSLKKELQKSSLPLLVLPWVCCHIFGFSRHTGLSSFQSERLTGTETALKKIILLKNIHKPAFIETAKIPRVAINFVKQYYTFCSQT